MLTRILKSRWAYTLAWLACVTPGAILIWRFYQAATGADPEILGANPVETLLHTCGRYAFTLLIITLAITPVRRLSGLNVLQRFRRTLGVFTFVYALLHLSTYLVFNNSCYSFASCRWSDIWDDVLDRPFIFLGMFAFIILLLLALTSTNGWVRRLGRRWGTLHRLIYVAAVAAVVHYAWGQKAVITVPLRWGAVLTVLLAIRLGYWAKKRRQFAPRPAP